MDEHERQLACIQRLVRSLILIIAYRQNEFFPQDNNVHTTNSDSTKNRKHEETVERKTFNPISLETQNESIEQPLLNDKRMLESDLEEEKTGFPNTTKSKAFDLKSQEESKHEEKRHSTRLQNKNINYDLMFDENNESNFLKESYNTDVKGRKCPESRWGRSEDKHLFKLIRDMEDQGILSLREILQINSRSNVYKHEGL